MTVADPMIVAGSRMMRFNRRKKKSPVDCVVRHLDESTSVGP
jgi:hypothetical protein